MINSVSHLNINHRSVLREILGYREGAHDVFLEIGVSEQVLEIGIFNASSRNGLNGFAAIKINSLSFNIVHVFPRHFGDIDFWLSAIYSQWMKNARV